MKLHEFLKKLVPLKTNSNILNLRPNLFYSILTILYLISKKCLFLQIKQLIYLGSNKKCRS